MLYILAIQSVMAVVDFAVSRSRFWQRLCYVKFVRRASTNEGRRTQNLCFPQLALEAERAPLGTERRAAPGSAIRLGKN
jgi:hypothetical protein